MKKTLRLFTVLFLLSATAVYAQISEGGIPVSFNYPSFSDNFDRVSLTPPDVEALLAADNSPSRDLGAPYRIAALMNADLSHSNAGTWEVLPGGEGRIWRLKIESQGAKAMALYFDNFYLPSGGKMFVYNEKRDQVIGAFTSANNHESGFFATEAIPGQSIIVEYFQPWDVLEMPAINISDVAYFYRGVSSLIPSDKLSGACEVNINCSEGTNWQDEKKGVVKIQIKNGSYIFLCSGSVMNNTAQDCAPYVLTADHCAYDNSYASTSDLNQWVFIFKYEASSYSGSSSTGHKSMTGCSLKAHDTYGSGGSGSDFYLVRINSNIPSTHTPYYNGWNKATTASTSGVSIHHPEGDIKKISTYTTTLTSVYVGFPNSHWEVVWAPTTNGHGVTEQGSSGSPIFNASGQVVGTLTGGNSFCNTPTAPDYYGKFLVHWTSNGSTANKQLKPWLDPLNTNPSFLNGTYNCTPADVPENKVSEISLSLYPNPATDFISVDFGKYLDGGCQLKVVNILGDEIYSANIPAGEKQISIGTGDYPAGIYFLKISDSKTKVSRKFSIVR